MQQETKIICKSCGKEHLTQNYCDFCGQKNYESRFTWQYILGEVLQSFNVEKGILFNIKALHTNSATTLEEYITGKTKPFYPPLQFFSLACGILFFLLLSHITSLVGIDSQKQAEESAEYYQGVYDKNYHDLASYLQDSLQNINHLDSLKTQIKNKGKELYNVRFLENDEKERAEKQANFLQLFTYLGFYFFPFYLAICSVILFKKTQYYFSEHFIIHLLVMGQVVFYTCFVFAIGFCLQYIFRSIETMTGLDMDTFVALSQIGLSFAIFLYIMYYLSKTFSQIFQEKMIISLAKTSIAVVFASGTAFLLSFVFGEIMLN